MSATAIETLRAVLEGSGPLAGRLPASVLRQDFEAALSEAIAAMEARSAPADLDFELVADGIEDNESPESAATWMLREARRARAETIAANERIREIEGRIAQVVALAEKAEVQLEESERKAAGQKALADAMTGKCATVEALLESALRALQAIATAEKTGGAGGRLEAVTLRAAAMQQADEAGYLPRGTP